MPVSLTMRDGTTALDPRLDRLVDLKPGNLAWGVIERRGLGAAVPKSVSHYLPSSCFLNQGREGQCVSYAFAHELAARPSHAIGFDHVNLRDWYWRMQFLDVWAGGEYPGGAPAYSGTSVHSGAVVHRELGHFKNYTWAFGEEQLRIGLQAGPAVIGVNWYEGMFDVGDRGFISPSGRLAGGHAIMVQGYNAQHDFYTLVNSWSRGWGKKGKCKVSRPDMARLLAEDGECCIPAMRTTKVNRNPVKWSV